MCVCVCVCACVCLCVCLCVSKELSPKGNGWDVAPVGRRVGPDTKP